MDLMAPGVAQGEYRVGVDAVLNAGTVLIVHWDVVVRLKGTQLRWRLWQIGIKRRQGTYVDTDERGRSIERRQQSQSTGLRNGVAAVEDTATHPVHEFVVEDGWRPCDSATRFPSIRVVMHERGARDTARVWRDDSVQGVARGWVDQAGRIDGSTGAPVCVVQPRIEICDVVVRGKSLAEVLPAQA